MNEIKERAAEIVFENQELSMDNPDMEIKVQAYQAIKEEIEDARERVRRQKIDEAKAYEATNQEILERLDAKLSSIRNSKKGNEI